MAWNFIAPGMKHSAGEVRTINMSVDITKLTLKGDPQGSDHGPMEKTTSRDHAALPVVIKLCESLKAEGIDYCHWKSNAAIDRSSSGENDLDLLVSHADVQRFTALLCQLGFHEAVAPREDQLPGVRDFYGYDESADRLIHVHAHYQLVLGHDFTKNYHLPIERAYLDSATQRGVCRIPAPKFEFVVFVIRMTLKHSTWDAILMGHGRLSTSERHEMEYLQSRINLEKTCVVLTQNLPFIDVHLFNTCVQALQPECSLWKRIQAGGGLQNKLQVCARRSHIVDISLKLWRRFERPILYRLHLRTPRKRLANGGLLVAIIGGDGSGKTTAVSELSQTFSEEFDVLKVHMGKPSWSWGTILIRGILKIGRSMGLYPFVKEGSELSIDTNSPSFPGYPWLIREVCTARDRYLDYKRARRFATNGGLVICDRFPLPQIRIMDGYQVERVTGGIKPNNLLKLLAALEHRYYRQIMLPDILIVLRVDPEICVRRKTDEPSESVRSRSGEIWAIDWRETPAHVIDAGRSKSQVVSEVLNLIWSHL